LVTIYSEYYFLSLKFSCNVLRLYKLDTSLICTDKVS